MSTHSARRTSARRLGDWLSQWLATEVRPLGLPQTDFGRLCEQLAPADVLLMEGRTRVSGIIQSVTLSSWTHAALYVGRLDSLPAAVVTGALRDECEHDDSPVVLEAEIGHGVHLTSLDRYTLEHLRVCRPRELSRSDARLVIDYALARLGTPYNLRHIADLLRFFFPYGLLPRRWRSTLFEAGHGDMVATICSTLIANAFASVRYPIVPMMHRGATGGVVFHRRNSRLITPRDFDYSPYFDVVKFPFFGDDVARYRELDWDDHRL